MADLIVGGRAAGRLASDFDPVELARGTQVELEHTSDPRIAQEIAMDHLVEDPRYYHKLAIMESPAFGFVMDYGRWIALGGVLYLIFKRR